MDRRKLITPLDPVTWAAATEILRQAQRGGQDGAEALNRAGLLITPARGHQLSLHAVKALREQLYGWSSVEMLRKTNRTITSATPADMYEAVLRYVDEFVAHVEENGI